jgi:hypothetical protein
LDENEPEKVARAAFGSNHAYRCEEHLMRVYFLVCFLIAAVALPVVAQAQQLDVSRAVGVGVAAAEAASRARVQSTPSGRRDSLWNGILIGAGAGALAGMLLAPRAFCRNDTECDAAVRVAIGLPAIGGGIGLGALVDALMKSPAPATPFAGAPSAHVNFRF